MRLKNILADVSLYQYLMWIDKTIQSKADIERPVFKKKTKIQLYVVYRQHSLDSKIHKLLYVCVCVQSLSHVQVSGAPWAVTCKDPSSWNFPGKNTGASCYFLLQGIFQTKGSNLNWQVGPLQLAPPGKPYMTQQIYS